MILVATDASAFVCFITRFTEENFATLIAFIFIKKAFGKVAHIGDHYPINPSPCFCVNNTIAEDPSIFPEFGNISQSFTFSKVHYNGTKKHYYPCEVCKSCLCTLQRNNPNIPNDSLKLMINKQF